MPGIGGTQRLVRAVGKAKAMRMALTGRPITAQEAWVAGLVSEIVPDAEVMSTALDMARTIAAMPPLAAEQIKEVILAGMDARWKPPWPWSARPTPCSSPPAIRRKACRLSSKNAPAFRGALNPAPLLTSEENNVPTPLQSGWLRGPGDRRRPWHGPRCGRNPGPSGRHRGGQ
jgi:hypothetical protein